MNTITLTLCASTRTGCLSAPIHSCADERLTLAGDVTLSAGTSVALLTPRGDTLAHTILSEECAPGATIPLSTLAAQAAEYTRSCRAGDTREALLAVGDSEHPLALIPARIAQNPLYTLAPPAALAPAYPTTETLHALLAEMQSASNAAAQSATAARKSAEEAGESASSAASDRATAVYAATSAQAYAEVATAAQARSSTSASEASTSAANADSSAAAARDAASSAISAANSAAGSASKAAASADSAAFALTASTNAANRAEVAAEKAREADISASSSASAASQSATAAAQEAAQGVTALLQGKVDAAEAAKAGAEAAQAAAETAKTGAEAAKAAAASSATAAANSATAAAKSATDLANAVSTAESLDGRILKLEKGKGVYQASDGSIQIYTPFDLCADGTLKVVKTVGKFRNILPVEVEESSTIFFAGDHNYIYFIVGTGGTFKDRLFVYDHNFNRIANYRLPILVSSYFGGCYRNDRLYLAKMNYGFSFLVLDKSGTVLKSFVPKISEEGATPVEDLGLSMFFYNPKSGHMCCFSPQPNGNGRPSYLFAFDDDLNQIVEEDGTYRVRSFRLATRFSMQAAVILGTAYLFPIRGSDYEDAVANCPVFRVTEDDSLEIVRESIPRTDEAGNILYMTEQVTDEAGNVTEEIARDEWNRNILLPQTDDGDEIRYNVAVSDKVNRPLMTAGGAFRIRPIVRYSNVFATGQYKAVTYFDGVDAYLILKDGRWIDLWRLNNPFDGTAKKLRPKNDRSSAFTKKTMRIFSCGTPWVVWGGLDYINNALVYDSAPTVPFANYHSLSLSIYGNVKRGADILFDLSVGTPLGQEYGGRNFNCLVYDGIPSACIFGSRPWTSTYSNIIEGGY